MMATTPSTRAKRARADLDGSADHAAASRARRRRATQGTSSGGGVSMRLGAKNALDAARTPGSIEEVSLVNFLTHDNLTVPLGPKVNFLNGQNGSGKSAVLASIMIALGGDTKSTGRGDKLSKLIQDGKPYCSITLRINNSAVDPYRPELYGNKILITRRIVATGSGSYTIKSASGNTISNQKKELGRITDHFGINVTNTLTWLTQDAAKEFLMSSNPQSLYRFFADGADITKARECFQQIGDKLAESSVKLQRINDSLKLLKMKRDEAKDRMDKARTYNGYKEQLAGVMAQFDWCRIAELENNLNNMRGALVGKQAEIDAAAANVQRLTDEDLAVAVRGVAVAEEQAAVEISTTDVEAARTTREAAALDKRQVDQSISGLRNDLQDAAASQGAAERALRAAEAKLSGEGQAARARKAQQLDEARTVLDRARTDQTRLQDEAAAMQRALADAAAPLAAAQNDRDHLHYESRRLGDTLERIRDASANVLNTWGRGTANAVAEIERDQGWTGPHPIGPLGRYVKPKTTGRAGEAGRAWLDVQRMVLGPAMSDYIVGNAVDRERLYRILDHHKLARSARILITDLARPLDLRGQLPDARFLSILDSVDISHPAVEKVLCINLNIERRILIEDRRQAEEETRHGLPPNVDSVYIPNGYQVGTRSGRLGLQAPRMWDMNRRSCPFGLQNGQQDPQQVEAELAAVRAQYADADALFTRLHYETSGYDTRFKEATIAYRRAQQLERQRARQVATLEEELAEDASAEIGILEAEVREATEAAEAIRLQLPLMESALETATATLKAAQAEFSRINRMVGEVQARKREQARLVNEAEKIKTRVERQIGVAQREVARAQETYRVLERQIADQEAVIVAAAAQIGSGRPNSILDRPTLDRLNATGRAKMRAIEDEVGVEALDMAAADAAFARAKKAFIDANLETAQLNNLMDRLRRTAYQRSSQQATIVAHVSQKAATAFRMRMAKRGFESTLEFDHANGALTVVTDMQAHAAALVDAAASAPTSNNKGGGGRRHADSKERSIRTYSGGEKSFSTVCLLLALWDTIPSPIRCLDEFDVYMDEVNRRVTMELLMDAAKKSDEQFVFITPLSVSNLGDKDDPDVDIIVLPAPARNNVQ
ncbi:P-loop containing nucleoside triphosphate hydrolase protein [Blastocladiella britannica]|nr:P-loop containing nucleoside triphosphate hydrolase protein [Blastocladiella britannica]